MKDIKLWFLIEGNNHSKSQKVVIHVFLANKIPGFVRRDEVRGNVKNESTMTYYTPQSGVRLTSPQQVSCSFGFYVSKEI